MKRLLLFVAVLLAGGLPGFAQIENDSTKVASRVQENVNNTEKPKQEKESFLKMAYRDRSASATNIGPGLFWGIKGNITYNSDQFLNSSSSTKTDNGATFYVEALPTLGYFFNDWSFVGLAASYSFTKVNEVGALTRFIYNLIGEIPPMSDSNTHTFKVQPYWRYRICNLFHPRIGLWAETTAYLGMSFSSSVKENTSSKNFLYGANLHPMVSFNVTDRLYFFTSLDVFSLKYDGAAIGKSNGNVEFYNNFDLNYNPFRALGRAVVNIGIIKRFY